jgi:hypothetical protein
MMPQLRCLPSWYPQGANELSKLDELDETALQQYLSGMTETSLDRTARSRKKLWRMRNVHTGQYLSVKRMSSASSVVTREVSRVLDLKTNSVSVLLDALKAATKRSRDDGTALQFTVEVTPSGELRIVELPAESLGESEGGAERELKEALEAARSRGRTLAADILALPEMVTAEELARRLGTTRATVNSKRQAHQVLGLQGATRGYRYPDWQIDRDGRPFASLPKLFAVLGDSPWGVYRFLMQHHGELGGLSGREALQRGLDREVIEAAQSTVRDFA